MCHAAASSIWVYVVTKPLQAPLQIGQHVLKCSRPFGILVQLQLDGHVTYFVLLNIIGELEGAGHIVRHAPCSCMVSKLLQSDTAAMNDGSHTFTHDLLSLHLS